jgi:glutamyl-tRNA synthetase
MTEVRVRIAPSPTGSPHVGTAFIGLFNYAFAHKHNGKFILRIEDTDQTRSHPVYEAAILDALRWVGLKWDEGPDIGGPHAPYRQSERNEIYRQQVEQLITKGGAYRCFCTEDRLGKMRAEQQQRKLTQRYDGKCRNLSEAETAKQLQEKAPYVIRLKVPQCGECVIQDRLRGEVHYDFKEIDDQVLLKSDGFPTYHLANVVDDHLMKISHVIRGEEWLPSTPKHTLIYDFMEWTKPEFIHMPLLLNPDGSKLSKRKNPTSIFYYRDVGYLPEALLNYLGQMGYTRPNGEEKFTLEEMIQDFDINRVRLGGSVFDLKKLAWLSGKYIRENFTPEQVYQKLQEWRFSAKYVNSLLPSVHERMETLSDFVPLCSFLWARDVDYLSADLIPKGRTAEDTAKILQCILFMFEEHPVWDATLVEQIVHEVVKAWKWKVREVTGALFMAITGKKIAPPLYQSMELLGKDMTRVRVVSAVQRLGGITKEQQEALEHEWRERRQKAKAAAAASEPPEKKA